MPVVQVILRAVDQMSNPAKQAEGALSSLKKQVGALGVSLGAMGVVGVAATTVQMVKLGVEVHRAEQAVIGFTGSAKAAKEAIAAVQAATGGAVSGMAAAQITSKLFAMGLAKTADEAAKLTDPKIVQLLLWAGLVVEAHMNRLEEVPKVSSPPS